MKEKNQIEMIDDVLRFNYRFDSGSAITQAVAYVLFNRYCNRLVNHMEDTKRFGEEITKPMVLDAVKHVKEVLTGYEESLLRN